MDEHDNKTRALDDLERDAERDRADLAGSVEALRGRLGSGGDGLSGMISSRARGYVEDRRAAAMDDVWRRVEEHPLQTVALAAAVAYPVVRVVTKIPAPILLLGAGVALAGRGGSGQSAPVQTEFGRSEPRVAVAAAPTGGVGTVPPSGQDARTRRMPAVGDAPVGDGAAELAYQASTEPSAEIGQRAIEAGRAGGENVAEAIRRNPAIAAGLSLVVGAALAAMLPRTRVEGRAFGDAAEGVRDQARSIAAEGIDAGRRAIGAAAEEADEQGLTGAGARDAIRDGADRAGGAIRDAGDRARDAIEGSSRGGSGGGSDGKPNRDEFPA